jgi:hypothetical protein
MELELIAPPGSEENTTSAPLSFRAKEMPLVMCSFCRNIIDYNFQDHHPTIFALKSSAASGCVMCNQFLRSFTGHYNTRTNPPTEPRESILEKSTSDPGYKHKFVELSILYVRGDWDAELDEVFDINAGSFMYMTFGIDIVRTSYSPTTDFLLPELNTFALSELEENSPMSNTRASLKKCKEWFNDCCSRHSRCSHAWTGFVPTRLIAVNEDIPRLCLSEELEGKTIKWATLSHRWFSLKFSTLTSSTLETYRRRIPSEALPKTFRDAIDVCRYIGLDFLWIDSLCILQDSKADWKKESVLMMQVYGECELNIAATAAEDASVGCFLDRPKHWIFMISEVKDNHATYPPSKELVLNVCLPGTWGHPARNALQKRAWVIQERYLSRRTLHFTDIQVFWECDERKTFEFDHSSWLNYEPTLSHYEFHLERRPLTRSSWKEIIYRYSAAHLTKPSDRLVAIAGLAKSIQNVTHEDYIAGMWRGQLEDPSQLLWQTCGDNARDPELTAPSWSWASLLGGICLPKFEQVPLERLTKFAVFHDLHFEYASPDKFGSVNNAVLRLRCKSLYKISPAALAGCTNIDGLHIDDKITNPAVEYDVAFLLPILEWHEYEYSRGLVLILSPAKGQYQRIGVYSLHFKKTVLDKPAMEVTDCVRQECHELFSEVVVQNGTKDYIIDLV